MSLHKYLYAHANPVMNSDPTGYFTLFEMSAVLNIQSKLQTASVSAAIGGLMGMMDALLGGERDPLNLLKSFASGAATGLVVGALFGGISALANLGCTAAKISVMLKLALTGVGVIGGGISTIQSFSDGKIAQGIFRGINTGIGAYGLKKCFGSAVKTFKSCENGSSTNIQSNTTSPSAIAKSWQGSKDYPGIDNYNDITIKKGSVIYRGEPNGTEYFTTKSAIESSERNARTIFEGLQVKEHEKYGYRSNMQGYMLNKDLVAAYGIAMANPKYGKGGLPQIFVPNANDLIAKGILIPDENILLIK